MLTAVAGKNTPGGSDVDEYKSELRKSLTKKKLDPEFLAGLDELGGRDSETGLDTDQGEEEGSTFGGTNTAMIQQDEDLWKSIWSQGRGVLCSNRHVDADYLEMEDEMGTARTDATAFTIRSQLDSGADSESKGGEEKSAYDHKVDAKDMSSAGTAVVF